jgi:hypothetical protein
VMLLGQFENRFTAFEIMTGHNARVIKLVQHATVARPISSPMSIRRLYKSSALT